MATAPTKRKTTSTTTTKPKATPKAKTAAPTTKAKAPVRKRAPAKPKPVEPKVGELTPPETEQTVPPSTTTLATLLAQLDALNPELVLSVGLKDKVFHTASAGSISTSQAIVMVASLASTIYNEMSPLDQAQVPLNAFLNNIGTVTTNQVLKTNPHAPLIYPMVKPNDKEGQQSDVGNDTKA